MIVRPVDSGALTRRCRRCGHYFVIQSKRDEKRICSECAPSHMGGVEKARPVDVFMQQDGAARLRTLEQQRKLYEEK